MYTRKKENFGRGRRENEVGRKREHTNIS